MIRLKPLLLLALPLFTLAGCGPSVLDPQGPIGAADLIILINAVEIMSVIVVPTIIAAVAFAWWFRASNTRARYLPHFAYSGRIELIVWSIPVLVIIFLGGVIWIGSHQLDPFKPINSKTDPIDVEVVSLDWKWLFIYPKENIATVNQLFIPANTPVHFSLTSSTVMNVFFVPQLGSMIYTMAGMVTQLNLEADHPGNFFGESAQYSGDGFSGMHFVLHALPPAQFADWVLQAHKTGPVLDKDGYHLLSQESQNVPPFTYRAVAPRLFQEVVSQTIPEAPGPTEGRGGVNVHPVGEK